MDVRTVEGLVQVFSPGKEGIAGVKINGQWYNEPRGKRVLGPHLEGKRVVLILVQTPDGKGEVEAVRQAGNAVQVGTVEAAKAFHEEFKPFLNEAWRMTQLPTDYPKSERILDFIYKVAYTGYSRFKTGVL